MEYIIVAFIAIVVIMISIAYDVKTWALEKKVKVLESENKEILNNIKALDEQILKLWNEVILNKKIGE